MSLWILCLCICRIGLHVCSATLAPLPLKNLLCPIIQMNLEVVDLTKINQLLKDTLQMIPLDEVLRADENIETGKIYLWVAFLPTVNECTLIINMQKSSLRK